MASAMSPRCAASSSSPSIATVAPGRAASARSRSANATSGWNAPACVPAAIAGRRASAPRTPLVWMSAWPAYRRRRLRDRDDDVVGDREDHELDVVDEGVRLGEPAGAGDVLAEPRPPGRDPATRPRPPASPLGRARCRAPCRPARRPRSRPPAVRPGPEWAWGWAWSLACSTSPWRWCPGAAGSRSTPSSSSSLERLLVVGVAPLGRASEQVVGLVPGPHRVRSPALAACARYDSTQRV